MTYDEINEGLINAIINNKGAIDSGALQTAKKIVQTRLNYDYPASSIQKLIDISNEYGESGLAKELEAVSKNIRRTYRKNNAVLRKVIKDVRAKRLDGGALDKYDYLPAEYITSHNETEIDKLTERFGLEDLTVTEKKWRFNEGMIKPMGVSAKTEETRHKALLDMIGFENNDSELLKIKALRERFDQISSSLSQASNYITDSKLNLSTTLDNLGLKYRIYESVLEQLKSPEYAKEAKKIEKEMKKIEKTVAKAQKKYEAKHKKELDDAIEVVEKQSEELDRFIGNVNDNRQTYTSLVEEIEKEEKRQEQSAKRFNADEARREENRKGVAELNACDEAKGRNR